MGGIFDGHNIEDRSTPLIKLEVDVVTLDAFNSFLDNYNDLEARILILENDHPSLLAHLLAPISNAHSGFINVQTQIPDASIGTDKVNFTVLTLGVAHNQAAYGDHLHDDRYLQISDGTGFVTLSTDQTITGAKTFTNAVFVDTQNFTTSDQSINLNVNHTAAAGHFVSGLSIWDPFQANTQNPAGRYFGLYYDSTDHRLKVNTGVTSPGGVFENTIAYISDVNAATNRPNGRATLPGFGSYVDIDYTTQTGGALLSYYGVHLSVERDLGSDTPDIGEVWYEKVSNTTFRIKNSGVNNWSRVIWQVIPMAQ